MSQNKGVVQLRIENEGGKPYCPVLLIGEKERILIDTCLAHQYEQMKDRLAEAGQDMGQLTHLFLTHQDGDHMGAAKQLSQDAPGLPIYAHELEAPYIDGQKPNAKMTAMERNLDALPPERMEIYRRLKNSKGDDRVPVDRRLKDGERAPLFGGITAIHTPGHTPGHMCLYLHAHRCLVAGDALNVDESGALQGPNPVHTIDMEEATRSLKKLLAFDAERVYCHHGGCFAGDVKAALLALIG